MSVDDYFFLADAKGTILINVEKWKMFVEARICFTPPQTYAFFFKLRPFPAAKSVK